MERTTAPVDRLVMTLEEQRLELGLSPRQLADLAGVCRQTVRNVETGLTRDPSTVTWLRLALLVYELYGHPYAFEEDRPHAVEEDLGALLHIDREEVVA